MFRPGNHHSFRVGPQENYKICLKSAGLHEVSVSLVGFVLFCLKALHGVKKCLNFDGLSEQGVLLGLSKKKMVSTSP